MQTPPTKVIANIRMLVGPRRIMMSLRLTFRTAISGRTFMSNDGRSQGSSRLTR